MPNRQRRELLALARDGAVVWSLLLAVAMLMKWDSACWRWSDVGWFFYFGLGAGLILWVTALFLSAMVMLSIKTLAVWPWPADPPDKQLDELLPHARGSLEFTREERTRNAGYAFRFGALTALIMAGILMLARLPDCPKGSSFWGVFW
jgi:hypothetical protein